MDTKGHEILETTEYTDYTECLADVGHGGEEFFISMGF